ncbi:MAG: DUF11 domain-containing protein [Chloroflexi bacterium]|nr:DUF11 domain-containing protein [Chloroflexota bacterium]
MSLRIPLRALLAAMLVLPMLLGALSTTVQAAPEPAVSEGPAVAVDSVAVVDEAGHFGFSVLNQVGSTTVSKSASPTSVSPGGTVTYTITVTAPPVSPPGNVLPTTFNVRDFLGTAFNFVSATPGSGVTSVSCTTSSGGSVPAGADPSAQQLLCALVVPANTTTATFTITATLKSGAFTSQQLTNAAAAPASASDPLVLAPAAPAIGSATINQQVVGQGCPVGTLAFATLSSGGISAQFATVPPSGIGVISPFISATSNQFVLTILGSTATPTLTLQTTSGTETPSLTLANAINPGAIFPPGIPFNPFQPGQTYLGSTTGTPIQGGTITVVVGGVTLTGTLQCQPVPPPVPPVPPAPPLQVVPPPPPPLLPPPPPAPMAGRGPAEVPVIPEADSLFLLAGGLAILGGLVVARTLRRRDDA